MKCVFISFGCWKRLPFCDIHVYHVEGAHAKIFRMLRVHVRKVLHSYAG